MDTTVGSCNRVAEASNGLCLSQSRFHEHVTTGAVASLTVYAKQLKVRHSSALRRPAALSIHPSNPDLNSPFWMHPNLVNH